jgi:hypothetical protein
MKVTFHLIHGDTIKIQVDVDQARRRNLASNIETALAGNYIGVVLDQKLTIIPTHNIKTIEMSPMEDVLIRSVISDAKLAE